MFTLFRRKIINISSASIPDFNWTKTKDDKSIIQWMNQEQTIAISVNFFEKPPDIPTMKNIETLRSFYRHLISNVNGGLIEVALSEKDTMPFIKTIFKLPQEGAGITYIASLTFPFKTCSFVFKVQAAEIGMTGMREALIANKLISKNEYSNWSSDPYDNNFKDGALMNKSEQYVYDIEFPDHPLTQARQIIKQIEMGLQWKPDVKKVPAFEE